MFYGAFYGVLGVVLLGLLVITPADAIRQALNNNQLYNVFVIAGCYFVTFFLAALIFTLRIWTNKAVLRSIPKTWIPVEKGDVNKKVRAMIEASFKRSAAIAWDSRPRMPAEPATIVSEPENRDAVVKSAESEENKEEHGHKEHGVLHKRPTQAEKDEPTVTIPPHPPVWGEIAHNGWSSPTSPDLPNLQYTTVILELPHLIEARAVSLSPPDAASTTQPPMPDIRSVALLQRPASMDLRDYIGHLTSVGIIRSPSIATDFLAEYEYARFSSRPLSERQFRDLMKQFAEVLRNMEPLSPAILASLDIDPPESDIDGDADSTTTATTHRSRSLASSNSDVSRAGSEGTIRTAPSRGAGTNGTSTQTHPGFSTAPTTPRSKKRVVSRSPSTNSFAQSRRPYNGASGSSSASLQSTSQGSVIKLSRTISDGELPYILTIPATR